MARKAGSHAEITGPAIQDAALRLFCQSGYAATSMRQIAAEVGVRAGALYLYTPDKQTLLFDLLNDHMLALRAAVDLAICIYDGGDAHGAISELEKLMAEFEGDDAENVREEYPRAADERVRMIRAAAS